MEWVYIVMYISVLGERYIEAAFMHEEDAIEYVKDNTKECVGTYDIIAIDVHETY